MNFTVWNAEGMAMNVYETVETMRGNKVERIRSSLFYVAGFVCLVIGVVLVTQAAWIGAFFILTACPCLFLYPSVRYLFGGKDSVAAVVGTVAIEEIVKSNVKDMGKKKTRKR